MTEIDKIREIVFRTHEWQMDALMSSSQFVVAKYQLGLGGTLEGYIGYFSKFLESLIIVKWEIAHGYSYDSLGPVSFFCFGYIP